MPTGFQIESFGESALLLRFGTRMDTATNARVHAAAAQLRELPGVVGITPGYASVLLRFDPLYWPSDTDWKQILATALPHALVTQAAPQPTAERAAIVLPVCYGDAMGPDLERVANHAGLDLEEVVRRHSGAVYQVAMLGFAPGFAYLLGMDEALATPRLDDPRLKVSRGSVGIAGGQTGVYPSELPGGWNLIGRTPQRLFDVNATPPALLQPAACVRFKRISEQQFADIEGRAG